MTNIYKYIFHYKTHSIIFKNFILIVLCVTIPLYVFFLLIYKMDYKNTQKEFLRVSENNISILANAFDRIYDEMQMLSYTTSCNPDVIEFCKNEALPSHSILDSVVNSAKFPIKIYSFIDSVYIYSNNNQYVVTNNYSDTMERFNDRNWISMTHSDNPSVMSRLKHEKYPYILTFSVPVFDAYRQNLGTVLINVNTESLFDFVKVEQFDTEIYILDQYGKLIFCNDADLIKNNFLSKNIVKNRLKETKSNESYLTNTVTSPAGNLQYVSIQTIKRNQFNKHSVGSVISIILLMLLFSLILSLFLTIKTFRPIESIIETLDDGEYGNNKLNISNEVQYILGKINHTILEKENVEAKLEQRLQLLNNAYMTALQAQINPHFLYNTLETINFLAYEITNDENDISTITLNLSKILRVSLDNNNKLISFREEYECLQLYIAILKIRYPDKCDYFINIPEKYMDKMIMKIILQPLIENAFQHGIKPSSYRGTIKLDVNDDGNNIYITVSDNGQGMTGEKYNKLQNVLNDETVLNSNHIGLSNVNSRIKVLYGKSYGVKCTNYTNGCTFLITIPFD